MRTPLPTACSNEGRCARLCRRSKGEEEALEGQQEALETQALSPQIRQDIFGMPMLMLPARPPRLYNYSLYCSFQIKSINQCLSAIYLDNY